MCLAKTAVFLFLKSFFEAEVSDAFSKLKEKICYLHQWQTQVAFVTHTLACLGV